MVFGAIECPPIVSHLTQVLLFFKSIPFLNTVVSFLGKILFKKSFFHALKHISQFRGFIAI